VVSVNHRLGPFGFLDLSGFGPTYATSGNAGMLDLVLALEWVRDNIAAFGGDPGNVTIFGQSGGGGKVSTLMAMPAAKGLFHRAIVQSGSILRVQTAENARQVSAALLKAMGIAPGEFEKLAQVSAPALIDAGEAARKAVPKALLGTPALLWQPVMDGSAVPTQTWTPGAPALSTGVPLMVGSALNEYSPSLGSPALEDMKEDQAKAMAGAIAGEKGAAAWPAYRAANPAAKPVEVLSRLVSAQFRAPAVEQARRKAAQGAAPAFLYRFDYQPAVLDGRARAFHCAELAYCFDNVDRCLNATGGAPEARALAAKIADAWIAFARTGNPNHRGLPHWPPVSVGQVPNMIFDAHCRVLDDPDRTERQTLAG
ncbi:MAG: carboxylesterase family protein, partial [Phenylobacterium sp.]